jgi:hypothetical protein
VLEAEVTGARAEERSYGAHFARVDEVRQRAEAKLKRAEIELRGAASRSAAPPSRRSGRDVSAPASVRKPQSPPEPEELDPEVAARAAERDARKLEFEQSLPAVTEVMQHVAAARRKVAGLEEKLLSVKNERAAVEVQFRRRGAKQGAEVAKAQQGVHMALAALGRAITVDPGSFGGAWTDARNEVAELDKVAARRDDDVMLHVMALDAHDRPMVNLGLGLVVGVVVLMLTLATLPFLLGSQGGPPQRAHPVTTPADLPE